MTATIRTLDQTLDILIDELQADDELRAAFFRNPHRMLRQADEWGLPLTHSEIMALQTPRVPVWEHVADALNARARQAA
ncbi:MAG: hypothetical protein AB7O28_13565 [Vicinamibacterales bacterium]